MCLFVNLLAETMNPRKVLAKRPTIYCSSSGSEYYPTNSDYASSVASVMEVESIDSNVENVDLERIEMEKVDFEIEPETDVIGTAPGLTLN